MLPEDPPPVSSHRNHRYLESFLDSLYVFSDALGARAEDVVWPRRAGSLRLGE